MRIQDVKRSLAFSVHVRERCPGRVVWDPRVQAGTELEKVPVAKTMCCCCSIVQARKMKQPSRTGQLDIEVHVKDGKGCHRMDDRMDDKYAGGSCRGTTERQSSPPAPRGRGCAPRIAVSLLLLSLCLRRLGPLSRELAVASPRFSW